MRLKRNSRKACTENTCISAAAEGRTENAAEENAETAAALTMKAAAGTTEATTEAATEAAIRKAVKILIGNVAFAGLCLGCPAGIL